MEDDQIKKNIAPRFRLSKHEWHQLAPNPQTLLSWPLQLSIEPLQLLWSNIEVEDYVKKIRSFRRIRRKSHIIAGSEECKSIETCLARSSEKGYLSKLYSKKSTRHKHTAVIFETKFGTSWTVNTKYNFEQRSSFNT